MKNVLKNKIFGFVIIGILMTLEIIFSAANWSSGDFNGGNLVLFIIMIGMLAICAIGMYKSNKWLMVVSGVSMLSVLIYIMTMECSYIIQEWIAKQIPIQSLVAGGLFSLGILLFIGCLVLLIIRLFNVTKHIRTLNTIFSLCGSLLMLVGIIIALAGIAGDPWIPATVKLFWFAGDFFAMFFGLLIASLGNQLQLSNNQ